MHIQVSLSFHFYLLYLLLNSCDGNDTEQRIFLGRLLVALKRAGCLVCWVTLKRASFSLAHVQSDVLLPSWFMLACNRFLHWPTASLMTFAMLAHVSMRRCFKSLVTATYVTNRCLYNVCMFLQWFTNSVVNYLADTDLERESPVFPAKGAGLFHEHRVMSERVISVIAI